MACSAGMRACYALIVAAPCGCATYGVGCVHVGVHMEHVCVYACVCSCIRCGTRATSTSRLSDLLTT
eukprot:507411-Rhodomonas_salina.1